MFQTPSSNTFWDTLFCWQEFIPIFSKGHNSRKGGNSDKKKNMGQAIFPCGIHIKFQNPSMQVHKIWHASDFILIFSRKGDNSDKKKRRVSATFPWGIHIWKFKTLACTVRMPQKVSRTDACTDNLNTICPINFFEVGGIIKLFPGS